MVVPLIMASGLASGETKPNLNGVWKMDPARSDFGTGPVSESRLDKISLDGVNLKDTIAQKLRRGGESTYDMLYTIDGKECENHVRGNLVKSAAHWEGDELVIDSQVFAFPAGRAGVAGIRGPAGPPRRRPGRAPAAGRGARPANRPVARAHAGEEPPARGTAGDGPRTRAGYRGQPHGRAAAVGRGIHSAQPTRADERISGRNRAGNNARAEGGADLRRRAGTSGRGA